jgi:hypothetical protein
MKDEYDIILESFKDKSNSLQRSILILLGASLFFFFMILIPYFSLKYDSYRISKIQDLIDKTNSDIQFIKKSFINLYKSDKSLEIDDKLNKYYNDLKTKQQNATFISQDTFPSCKALPVGSNEWIRCNASKKSDELQGQINKPVILNSSQTKKLSDAIDNQNGLISLARNFVDTDQFTKFKNNLTEFKDKLANRSFSINIDFLVRTYLTSQAVLTQNSVISNQTNTLLSHFNPLELPIVGKIPMEFDELVAIFPISLAVVFAFCTTLLRDTMHLRKLLEDTSVKESKKKHNIKPYFNTIAPIWVEPKRDKQDSIPSWIVLLTPAILFCASVWIIHSIWDEMSIENDKFPPFTAASDLNKLYYKILYGVSAAIFVYCYWRIIKELRTNFKDHQE